VIDGNLVAQRFDAAKQALQGQASPLVDGVEFYNPRDIGQYSVSGAGLVVYRRNRLRQTQLVWLDRSGKEAATVGEPSYYGAVQLGADGRTLAAVRSDAAGANADVWILDLQRAQVTRATFASAPSDLTAALSPDGRWVAYQSDETGRAEVFVSDFPRAVRKWQASRSGGQHPTWRGDGRELFFVDAEGAVAVSVAAHGDALELGTPERLPFSQEAFAFESSTGSGRFGAAVRSPDGKRFLVARYDSQPVIEPVRLVRSWRRLVEQ